MNSIYRPVPRLTFAAVALSAPTEPLRSPTALDTPVKPRGFKPSASALTGATLACTAVARALAEKALASIGWMLDIVFIFWDGTGWAGLGVLTGLDLGDGVGEVGFQRLELCDSGSSGLDTVCCVVLVEFLI